MLKKCSVLCVALCVSAAAYAQKNFVKTLEEAAASKTPVAVTSAVSAQLERQVARETFGVWGPLAPEAYIPPVAALSLERVKAEALHPQMDISKLVPVRPTKRTDLVNRALLRVQHNIQQNGELPKHYRGYQTDAKVTWLAYYRLLLQDRNGKLSPEEQAQLRSFFWHTHTSISSVERKLQSWQDRYGANPLLPDQEMLDYLSGVNKPPHTEAFEEWALAADVYMLKKLYGSNLPKRLKEAQSIPFDVKTLKIINLPDRPRVRIRFDVPLQPGVKNSVRLVSPRQVYPTLYKLGERKMFVPRDFVNQTKALYRGIAITDLDELKNILSRGLEINKSNFGKKIFTAYEPLIAVLYAQPTHLFGEQANLPVLIKIPLTPSLEQYPSEKFETARAFQQSLPADAVSDVWILLEVNKKADWYRAVLENGEIVLSPAHGQLQDAQ